MTAWLPASQTLDHMLGEQLSRFRDLGRHNRGVGDVGETVVGDIEEGGVGDVGAGDVEDEGAGDVDV